MKLERALKVHQLIELLKEAPQNASVRVEGCDCIGEACGIDIGDERMMEDSGAVIVTPTVTICRFA